MRPRGFIEDWRPRQKSLDLLAKVEAIIAEYAMPLTIRQIFYRLVGRHGYDKTEQAYDNLGELLTKARRAQRISMEAIRDDGFVNHHPQCFARNRLRGSATKTLSGWHQYLDECPPDEAEIHAVSMACRTTVGSHR
jgi:hypothetical protein